jgi:hypothetical protein
MQDLRLVAANDAGSHLLLRSMLGEQFRLPIDERLRAAVRGDRARLGQLEIELDGQLRPRDIQARIRAGESAEKIAHEAGVPVERVRRFEGPVLAERGHMAQMAQRASVRRPTHPEGPSVVLGEAVAARLDALGVHDEALEWDSWRREDGRWTVLLVYLLDGELQRAHFCYDPRARTAVPEDDDARWLVGDLAERPGPAPFVPRLAPAPTAADDAMGDAADHALGHADDAADDAERLDEPDEAAARFAAGQRLHHREPAIERPRRMSALDILVPPDAAGSRPEPPPRRRPYRPERHERPERPERQQRPERQEPPERPERPAARMPAIGAEQARHPAFLARRDQAAPPPPTGPAAAHRRQPVQPPAATAPQVMPREQRLTGTADAGPDRAVERSAGRAGPHTSPRSRRASVPSWDEILFGTRRRGE